LVYKVADLIALLEPFKDHDFVGDFGAKCPMVEVFVDDVDGSVSIDVSEVELGDLGEDDD